MRHVKCAPPKIVILALQRCNLSRRIVRIVTVGSSSDPRFGTGAVRLVGQRSFRLVEWSGPTCVCVRVTEGIEKALHLLLCACVSRKAPKTVGTCTLCPP